MSTTEDTTYNGWTNYETWCVKLWMDNDYGTYLYWQAIVDDLKENSREPGKDELDEDPTLEAEMSRDEAVSLLSEQLQQEIETAVDDLNLTGVLADLLGHAVQGVNWREIASNMMND